MKKFIWFLSVICFVFFSFTDVDASTTIYNRNERANLGVNKKWVIDYNKKNNVLNTPLVDASEKIYDFANILTDEEESKLFQLIQQFIKEAKMDLVIFTVDVPYGVDLNNEEYATDFYDYNDFGMDFEKYDGVLIFRNAYSSDPFYNIYTFGDAQLYFPFERCEEILDSIYPYFSTHNYMPGYERSIYMLEKFYRSGVPSQYKHYYVDDMGYVQKKYVYPIIIIPISMLFSGIIVAFFVGKNKMIKRATKADTYLDSKSIGFSERRDEFIRSHTTHYTMPSSSSGSSSGGGFSSGGISRSGSSGGGHGGGGGRHG